MRVLNWITNIILGIFVFSIGFYGAMLVDSIYDINKDFIKQELLVENLSKQINGQNEIYNLQNEKPFYHEMKKTVVYMAREIYFGQQLQGKISGTGVIVKQDYFNTYILTNKHVCNEKHQNSCTIEIFKHDNIVSIPLTFIKQAKNGVDMALWKTSAILPNKQAIKGLHKAYPQDKVYSVGNYLGFPYIYTEGTFAGYEGKSSVVNLPCVYGCSGSPVFDKEGCLIGLVYAVNKIGQYQVDTTKSIIVPYEELRLFLRGVI